MTPEERAVIDAAIERFRFWIADETASEDEAICAAVSDLLAARKPTHVWLGCTFRDLLAGDRVRLGGQEASVLRSSMGVWHADNADAWHPKAWPHVELRLELDVNPGFIEYPAGTSCEILCTPERAAILAVQQGFPGSSVIPS